MTPSKKKEIFFEKSLDKTFFLCYTIVTKRKDAQGDTLEKKRDFFRKKP
nr:MAG TPA: hypothetical protein [Microviridae sp.]